MAAVRSRPSSSHREGMLAKRNYVGDEQLLNNVEWRKMGKRRYVACKEVPWEPAVLCVTTVREYHLTSDGGWRGPTTPAEHIYDARLSCMTELPHNVPFALDDVTAKNLKLFQDKAAEGDDLE